MAFWSVVLPVFALFAQAGAVAAAKERPLLKEYKGEESIPDDLYSAYEQLVDAMQRGNLGRIRGLCLPDAVNISTKARREPLISYGEDINIPFVQAGLFHKNILHARRSAPDIYSLNTATSHMLFVRTKSMGWRLYVYWDKPME